jgi:hypothetical protein
VGCCRVKKIQGVRIVELVYVIRCNKDIECSIYNRIGGNHEKNIVNHYIGFLCACLIY